MASSFFYQNFRVIDDMRKSDMLRGLPKLQFSNHLCRNCVARKYSRNAFPTKSSFRASKRFELIHGDICGPIQPSNIVGRRYYFLPVDIFLG